MAKKPKLRNPKIEFDELQMYFGKPYVIDLESAEGSITIYQPTIGDIIDIGENKFFSSLSAIVSNTTQYKVMLWDLGMDWNKTSDFELFILLHKSISDEVSQLLFHLNFSEFEVYERTLHDVTEVVMYSKKYKIAIDKNVFNHMAQYLQNVFQIKPEEKITSDPVLKRLFLDKDRRQQEREAKKDIDNTSNLKSIISACVNHPGFKYRKDELKELCVCEFYDSVQRLQIYESTTALMKGMYSGFVDGSKIKPEDYNFMKSF